MFTQQTRKQRKPKMLTMPKLPSSRRPGSGSSAIAHASMALGISGMVAVGLWYLLSREWTWQPWALAWLAAINATALGYYAFDKSRARRSRQRVPEIVLLGIAVLGGSGGAYLGMHIFKHKTVKGRFQIVFWSVVVLQLGLLAVIVRHLFFTPSQVG